MTSQESKELQGNNGNVMQVRDGKWIFLRNNQIVKQIDLSTVTKVEINNKGELVVESKGAVQFRISEEMYKVNEVLSFIQGYISAASSYANSVVESNPVIEQFVKKNAKKWAAKALVTLSALILYNYNFSESNWYFRKTVLLSLAFLFIKFIRDKILAPCMIVPAVFMSWIREQEYTRERERYLSEEEEGWEPVYIETNDFARVKLSAVKWVHPSHKTTAPSSQKWLLFLNPNGAAYEELFAFLKFYGLHIEGSVLAFNYRGVGSSTGSPNTARDLVTDAEAAFNYLLMTGVKSKNILIHGHSLGGAVGALLRQKHPEGPFISDRSFSRLTDVVTELLHESEGLRTLAAIGLGAFSSTVLSAFFDFSYLNIFMQCGIGTVAMAALSFKQPSLFIRGVVALLKAIGWEMDVVNIWKSLRGPKLVVYHPLDGVIVLQESALASALNKDNSEGTHIVKLGFIEPGLHEMSPLYHCYPLSTVASEWSTIVNWAKRALYPPLTTMDT